MEVYRDTFRRGFPGDEVVSMPAQRVVRTLRERGVTKVIQRVGDDSEIESVILEQRGRAGRGRATLCLSSQVGCGMGCAFCQTGRMGFQGNLTTSQIVGQYRAARFDVKVIPSNIVFMGMGEPMENLGAVLQAVRVLADGRGAGIAPSRISISTVGRVEGIARLGAFVSQRGYGRLGLAVSLNAPNDEIRSRLMPINRVEPMGDLLCAMKEFTRRTGTAILIGYVLIPGVNDAAEHADQLAGYLRGLRCKVNVIPYNPIDGSVWTAPSEEAVQRFARRLVDGGLFVKRRETLGRQIEGACGQLGRGGG